MVDKVPNKVKLTPYMPQTLPDLPYATDALEPYFDAQTMILHHDKHHQAYVDNLNKALTTPEGAAFIELCPRELMAKIHEIPAAIQTAVRNNGGAHFNHSFFWRSLAPHAQNKGPIGKSAKAIEATFGGLDGFKEAFTKAAMGRFGSGWAWLYATSSGELKINNTPYQDNPLMQGLVEELGTPLLCIDVWEHSYYLKYQNRRADYIKAFFEIIDWERVEKRYNKVASPDKKCGCGGSDCCCG
jgi:Fe-Mn family superoxide dismutase